MEATLDELLQALGEKTAENFILRKQIDALQRRVQELEEQPIRLPSQEVS